MDLLTDNRPATLSQLVEMIIQYKVRSVSVPSLSRELVLYCANGKELIPQKNGDELMRGLKEIAEITRRKPQKAIRVNYQGADYTLVFSLGENSVSVRTFEDKKVPKYALETRVELKRI